MAIYNFDSSIEGGRFTRLTFDATKGAITGIQLYQSPNTLLDSLPIAGITSIANSSLFNILFIKFDLANRENNQNHLGAVDYQIRTDKNPSVTSSSQELRIQYSVGGNIYPPIAATPAWDNIKVVVTFRTSDPGWIDLDIEFNYPSQVVSNSSSWAWETRIMYPRLLLDRNIMSNNNYTLLHPAGRLVPFAEVAAATPDVSTMPVQFASLFKFGRNNTTRINYVRGVAFMATDENGHEKQSIFFRPDGTTIAMNLQLISPIHLLKGNNPAPAFVRPPNPTDTNLSAYRLSRGDAGIWGWQDDLPSPRLPERWPGRRGTGGLV